MPHLGFWELMIILVIVLLIFGAGKLPQIRDALGRSRHRRSPGELRRDGGPVIDGPRPHGVRDRLEVGVSVQDLDQQIARRLPERIR